MEGIIGTPVGYRLKLIVVKVKFAIQNEDAQYQHSRPRNHVAPAERVHSVADSLRPLYSQRHPTQVAYIYSTPLRSLSL